MANKRHKPEEIMTKLRWVEGLAGQRLARLQKEYDRLGRAVSDLTLDKLILTEASRGNV